MDLAQTSVNDGQLKDKCTLINLSLPFTDYTVETDIEKSVQSVLCGVSWRMKKAQGPG